MSSKAAAPYPGHHILETVSEMDNYHKWIIEYFRPYFGTQILEVGSGSGTLSQLLPGSGDITLTDIDRDYVEYLKKNFSHPVVRWDVSHPQPESLPKSGFDTVFSSNVLEHVKDDTQAFKNIHTLLKPGGRLLLFVPASPAIFGELDRQLHHFRRYEKNSLREKLTNLGYRVERIEYHNFVGFFAWGLVSRVLSLKQISYSSFSAKMFDKVFSPFLWLENSFPPPFGQNLAVVAVKQ